MKQFFRILAFGPLSLLYGLVITIRNKMYDWKICRSVEFEMPVVSVGNITVGGTGKTPHTEMLVSILHPFMKVAVLSRGYKRETKGFRYVEVTDTTREAGDEPLQIKRKFSDVTVAVDVDRVRGINRLMKEVDGLGVVILDDAFQYRKVQPALSLLMIDYNRPIQKDYLLPLGRLRDYANQQRRADVIFLTKCPKQLKPIERSLKEKDMHIYPYQQLYFTTFEYGKHYPVFQAKETDTTESIVITGIANPKPFLEQLEKKYTLKKHLKYPDHHRFSGNDIRTINAVSRQYPDASIFTTEKDALRLYETKGLDEQVQQRLFYIPIEVVFLSEKEKNKFVKYIVDFIQKNRRNTILHSIL